MVAGRVVVSKCKLKIAENYSINEKIDCICIVIFVFEIKLLTFILFFH